MTRSFEEVDSENLIRKQAEYAQSLQKTITEGQELEKWVNAGHFDFLESRIFTKIEQATLSAIKSPEFDPANISQVAQMKALCQTLDLIRGNIDSQIYSVQDARAKLLDLENSTLNGREGE